MITPKQSTIPNNFFKSKTSEAKNKRDGLTLAQKKIEEKRLPKNPLHDYLTEDDIHPPEDDLKDKVLQLEVIEQNLKEIQGKCFMPTPPNLKHFRYPSFGRGGLEKDGKLSTRRATSQDANSPKASEQKIKEIKEVKEKSKEPQPSKSFTEIKNLRPYYQPKRFETTPTEGPTETDNTINNTIMNTTNNAVNKTKVEESAKVKKSSTTRPEPKIAYASLMKSLELRKSLQQNNQQNNTEEKRMPWEGKKSYGTLERNYDFFGGKESVVQSIYSHGTVESPNKRVVDIYDRNSRWLLGKDERIKNLVSVKNKEELNGCTFKPNRRPTASSDKIKDELELRKFNSEKSHSPNPRNVFQEKRAMNSYQGIHQIKKGVYGNYSNQTSSQASPFSSPKSKFYQ